MININGINYKLKFTVRAMMLFEQITKRMFSISSLTDEYLYLYCLIMANNTDADLTFDGLLDAIDEDNSIMEQFKEALNNYTKQNSLYSSDSEEGNLKKN